MTSEGFAELRAFLGRLAPPEPLEAMYKEARSRAAEVEIYTINLLIFYLESCIYGSRMWCSVEIL